MAGPFERVMLIVFDSVGIGGMPDAADYGDEGRDTPGHIAELRGLNVPIGSSFLKRIGAN